MRTIQIINCKWYNATFWYALYLTKILNEHGHESILVTIPNSLGIQKLEELGIDYTKLPLNSFSPADIYASYRGFSKLCREFRPDIVNCHRGEAFYLFSFLKKVYGYELIRTRGDQRKPSENFINKFLHNSVADAIITTNSDMSEYFHKNLHVPENKIHTILGGVDTKKFFPQKENQNAFKIRYGFKEDDVLLGIIGRLDAIKGFHETILAFHKAAGQSESACRNLHLLVAGLNCDFTIDDLKDFCKEHGISQEHIHFYSYLADMNAFMNMLDVGVVASLGSETIARVAFELIACHTPIIGSRIGVMPDILENEYLFNAGQISEMTGLFIKCLNKGYRERLLRSCLNNFYGKNTETSLYGWSLEDFYQKTIQVYSQLFKPV